jgi:hypothetical protein
MTIPLTDRLGQAVPTRVAVQEKFIALAVALEPQLSPLIIREIQGRRKYGVLPFTDRPESTESPGERDRD